ncbi:TnsA endonuclease N-terminal domain-containing protein [Sulfurimonas sp.]
MDNTPQEPINFIQRKLQKNYRSITGHFPSVKNNKSIAFESKLESELFLSLEFDNDVESYLEQPQITITVDGKEKPYHADCFIKMLDGSNNRNTIVEAKYTTEVNKDKEYYDKKFKAANITANDMNMDFLIYTELSHSKTYIFNLNFLYRYKTQPRENKFDDQIKHLLSTAPIAAIDIAKSISTTPNEYMIASNAIWGLVAHGELLTDLEKEINMNSIIEINNGSN